MQKIELCQGSPRHQLDIDSKPFQELLSPDGSLWAQFYRVDGGYLLRFPGLADFEVPAAGQSIMGWPLPHTAAGTIQHLFLNQVLPLAQSRLGQLVFHASAVVIDNACVAFMGESGRGKSTLAASFAGAGFPFLTDDSLFVEQAADACRVLPSHASIRLWEDSQRELVRNPSLAPAVDFTDKARLLAGDELPFCTQSQLLRCCYVLGPGTASGVDIEPLTPSAALVALLRNSFLLDLDRQAALAAHFDELSQLVRNPIFFSLDYPRRYDNLESVRQAIAAHAAKSAA
jgi:hypothetical protein